MLPLTASDSSNSTISWHWVRNHAWTRFDCVSSWLLQHSNGLVAQVYYWQTWKLSLLPERESLIAASFVGWTFPKMSNISSESRCMGAFKIRLQGQYMRTSHVSSSAGRTKTSSQQVGRRVFSVAGPMISNLLPDSLRDPTWSIDSFRSTLKTCLFAVQRDT